MGPEGADAVGPYRRCPAPQSVAGIVQHLPSCTAPVGTRARVTPHCMTVSVWCMLERWSNTLDTCPNNVKRSSHAPTLTPLPAPEQQPRARHEERQGLGRRLASGRPRLSHLSLRSTCVLQPQLQPPLGPGTKGKDSPFLGPSVGPEGGEGGRCCRPVPPLSGPPASVNQDRIICGLFEQIISNNRQITTGLFAIICGLFVGYLRLFADYL